MAEERALAIRRVVHEMDSTRQAIQRSVGELRARARETADWRYHVSRRPVVSLLTAAALGLIAARILVPSRVLTRRSTLPAAEIAGRAGGTGIVAFVIKGLGLVSDLGILPWLTARARGLAARAFQPPARTAR
jgi:hypothetical protein